MTELLVRDAEVSDADALTAIYRHHVCHGTASFEVDPPSVAEMARRIREIVDQAGLPYLVAEVDGVVRGYAYVVAYRSRPAYRFTLEDSVYVAPGWEGRGIGSALLAELIARCEALSIRQVVAVIGDSANIASTGLHERAGFVRAGTLVDVGWKHGQWLDTVFMQRRLGLGADTPPE